MKELNASKVAITFALLTGGWHVVWTILILTGLAQPIINFIFWLHMVSVPYNVTGFSIVQAVSLIVTTFLIGYVVGLIFAFVWNKMHK